MIKGGPESVRSSLGGKCLEKMSSRALMLASAKVLFTMATSGYLLSRSITTSRCLPSGVGPQWSAATLTKGLVGAVVGFRGSLV